MIDDMETAVTSMSAEQSISILERMLMMRRFEETVLKLLADEIFEAHCHVYIGQEATAAPIMELLRDDDLILTTHRNHGHIIGRGGDPGGLLAEILGRTGGFNKGRAGGTNACARSVGFLATTGVVGGSLGLGIGAAHAQKLNKNGGISLVFFGDGALEEGIAFEALNIAKLYSLPALFVCENNSGGVTAGRADGAWSSSSLGADRLADVPRSLGIRSASVDGTDANAVFAVAQEMINSLRVGQGPAFIEATTYRWPGSRGFRPRLIDGTTDLSNAWTANTVSGDRPNWSHEHDPVIIFLKQLLAENLVTRKSVDILDSQAIEKLATARKFALASPMVDSESVLEGTFA